MKHTVKITIILLAMFFVTQFIGLAVIHADPFNFEVEVNGTLQKVANPALNWIHPPEAEQQSDFFTKFFPSIIVAFIIAIGLLFLMTKFKLEWILKTWFFLVITFAIWLTLYAFEILVPFTISSTIALIIPLAIALPLTIIKMFQRNFIVHNFTELLIYPGIASVFVPILSFWSILVLLAVLSLYDMWAVWNAKIMQGMAKYQMNKLKIFAGFFVPYFSKGVRAKLKNMKKSKLKKTKVKMNVAILGGGDIIFPIITAGVIMLTSAVKLPFGLSPFMGGFWPAVFVVLGAALGLGSLFFCAKKKVWYPAMPFITAGILLGIILGYLVFSL